MMKEKEKLEKEFYEELHKIYYKIKDAEISYNPKRYKQLIDANKGVNAARKLLSDNEISYGLMTLWEGKMLDTSVECLVLQDKWHSLFTPEELNQAEEKLKKLNYNYKTNSYTNSK